MADQTAKYNEEAVGSGHPTKADVINRLVLINHNIDGTHEKLDVGSDADGDMYYRASGVLARLAKGAANLKLFMNAGATAPEWASGTKVIVSLRTMDAASAPVAYTIGFTPSAFLMICGIEGVAGQSYGGYSAGAPAQCIAVSAGVSYYKENIACLYETLSKYQVASVTSLGSDVIIAWTRVGDTAAGNIYIIIFAIR